MGKFLNYVCFGLLICVVFFKNINGLKSQENVNKFKVILVVSNSIFINFHRKIVTVQNKALIWILTILRKMCK